MTSFLKFFLYTLLNTQAHIDRTVNERLHAQLLYFSGPEKVWRHHEGL